MMFSMCYAKIVLSLTITYLYDIPMQEELPDYLQYDFGVAI